MKTTNDLMNILTKNVNSPEELNDYINDIDKYKDLDFISYFSTIMKSHNHKKSDLAKNSNISRTYVYQLLNGTKKPSRDNIIALCITSDFTLEETIRCLEISKEGILYPKNKRDSLIIYAINHKYNISKSNELLFKNNEVTLS